MKLIAFDYSLIGSGLIDGVWEMEYRLIVYTPDKGDYYPMTVWNIEWPYVDDIIMEGHIYEAH